MARRRMFSLDVIDSDHFMDMPPSTQNLYFHLGMRADDEGFVSNPKRVARAVSATEDDAKILVSKGFIIPFESGVCVVTHWTMNNYIQSDRFKPSIHSAEKNSITENSGMYTKCIQKTNTQDTQVRLGKVRLGKVTKDTVTFSKPTIEEVAAYCKERGNSVDPKKWFDHYTANGWKVGRTSMKDWQAAVRTWEHNNFNTTQPNRTSLKVHQQSESLNLREL